MSQQLKKPPAFWWPELWPANDANLRPLTPPIRTSEFSSLRCRSSRHCRRIDFVCNFFLLACTHVLPKNASLWEATATLVVYGDWRRRRRHAGALPMPSKMRKEGSSSFTHSVFAAYSVLNVQDWFFILFCSHKLFYSTFGLRLISHMYLIINGT
jgi:hypothetical protein